MQELSLNVLDVVQNSIVAGASLIEITVSENSDEADNLVICINDNGKGMTKEQVEKVIDPFYTTRTTRDIGLGVPLFKQSAEMTGGNFSIFSEVGQGTRVKAVYNKNHIDCMPVGDILGTVNILVMSNPDIDFIYTMSRNEKSFTLDTREIREVLEGLPLNDPAVTEWIGQYLIEQEGEL